MSRWRKDLRTDGGYTDIMTTQYQQLCNCKVCVCVWGGTLLNVCCSAHTGGHIEHTNAKPPVSLTRHWGIETEAQSGS